MKNSVNKSAIHIVAFSYWAVLLIWQNIRSAGNRGTIDVLIKMGMLGFFVIYYFLKARRVNFVSTMVTFALLCCVVALFFTSGAITFSNLLYYIYPILLFFLVYALGNDRQIRKKQLVVFLNLTIIAVGYIALYAMFFQPDKFLGALSLSSAYGNELASFLVSNYEYGIYLAYGMVAILLCLEIDESVKGLKRIVYLLMFAIFALNLVLTFSRTSIIAFVLMTVVGFSGQAGKRTKKLVVLAVVTVATVLMLSSTLREFFVSIVFKDNAQSGRPQLIRMGLQLFSEVPMIERLFGSIEAGWKIEQMTNHANLHNGYLQMLMTNGLKGIVFLFGVILSMVWNCSTIKVYTQEEQLLKRCFIGFILGACICMFTATSTIFYSSIDSYFLTLFAVIVPKYACNSIRAGTFED